MKCVFDNRWIGPHGIGRFAKEVSLAIPHINLDISGRPMSPVDPLRLSYTSFPRNSWFFSPGYNAPLLAKLPYIFTIHDLNHIDRPDNSSRLKVAYYRTVLRKLARDANAIVTVSEFSKQRISDFFGVRPDTIFVVGNGVSEEFFSREVMHDSYGDYALCVGNRKGHKNEVVALKSFLNSSAAKDLKLVFSGDSSRELISIAEEHKAAHRLVFAGKLSEKKLALLYRNSKFLLFPSLYEGFGLPIIEAFASGTPVIASNVSAMPEIAGDAALTVDPLDEEAITGAINLLLSDDLLRVSLVERGFVRAKAYSWNSVHSKLRMALNKVGLESGRVSV